MPTLTHLAKTTLPPPIARQAKAIAVHARYLRQKQRAQAGYRRFADRYPQPLLFVAGLPKSGTTWLERMLSGYPGFQPVLIPDATAHELRTGGSHDYELPEDIFTRLQKMLVITKMHIPGSPHNANLLKSHNIPYVVLYRDLRDVAVSHYFYVRRTPWHPEYPIYRSLDVTEGLLTFAQRTLLPFATWVRSWHNNRNRDLSVIFSYEEMLQDTVGVMTQIASHFQLDSSRATIEKIVEAHRFQRLSGGRQRGQDNQSSFFRKGIAGDWRNHFSDHTRQVYKKLIGDFLIEFEYETSFSW